MDIHNQTPLSKGSLEHLNQLNKIVAKEVEHDEALAVVVIFTDGYEIASRQYNRKRFSSISASLSLSTNGV